MTRKYKFTVFTPCYNAEVFIHRVYESLCKQTFRDFEWLVINDASKDSTLERLRYYKSIADFEVRIIDNPQNMMLAKNFNRSFEEACGEYFVALGHDDSMEANALEVFNEVLTSNVADDIAGICCLCKDQNGSLVGGKFTSDFKITDYFSYFKENIYRKERWHVTRTSVLRNFPFDVSKFNYIPEEVLWGRIGLHYKTIFINQVLRTYYIENENTASLTKKSRTDLAPFVVYSYGVWINEFFDTWDKNAMLKLRFVFAYIFHATLDPTRNIFRAILDIRKCSYRTVATLCVPIALLLKAKLKLQKKL